MADREENVYMARLAEQAERYSEMVDYMKGIAKQGVGLNSEERNLLSVAYKNVIGSRRAAWRIVSNIKEKEKEKENEMFRLATAYLKTIEDELKNVCDEILELLDKDLIPSVSNSPSADNPDETEAAVFYYKMKGDYMRYKAEFAVDNERKEAAEYALVAYKTASEKALPLPAGHAIRLGLALNFSVFYYEILNSPDRACRLAKQAFDEAVPELQDLPEDNYKDSTLIMQLLRDNLTLWTSDMQEDGDKNDEQLQDIEDS